MDEKLVLKNLLKEARAERKLSQTQLAEMVGVSRTDLGTSCPKVEQGKRAAPLKVPPFCVSPRDKGDCRSLFRIALEGGPHGRSRTRQRGIFRS